MNANLTEEAQSITVEELSAGIICASEKALVDLGEAFGKLLECGDVVALHGNLGVGKTTFTKGIARALNIREPITSPTFNLMAHYPGIINLVHIDAYRLNGHENLGVWDYSLSPAIIVVEWPENLPELNGNISKNVQIDIEGPEKRCVRLLRN
ncbi:MAG: tRNA (adenosine(37)-N6)-threonylcarbamoyltransferase complex ATPase subunit type 1 TsaE [Puniceicoccales bacterium]|jgi:tRNA threonylcarbamoyladenosine biosynthesis protein TsaE|nr:tRNA (adenosine(37)-N6)-threonylcarbamoyltransferase complex ATPase subunit type 1 TsaE [Puniceicoccales bacterium]